MKVRNLVVCADLHSGCRYALCPKIVRLDGGGSYIASPAQRKILDFWEESWGEWVPAATRGEPYAICVNGDLIDGVHHKSTTQISHNKADQRAIAVSLLGGMVDRCEGRLYVNRGTSVHGGESGEDEEDIARTIGAKPDREGFFSRYETRYMVGEALVHTTHHVGTTGSSHCEPTAVFKELTEAYVEAGRNRVRAPDVIVRSHRHRCIRIDVPTVSGNGIAISTPGWQLKTPFVYRLPGGRAATPQIGLIVVRYSDGEVYARSHVCTIMPPEPDSDEYDEVDHA